MDPNHYVVEEDGPPTAEPQEYEVQEQGNDGYDDYEGYNPEDFIPPGV